MRLTCTDLMVAAHSHSAQGRVHFINADERSRDFYTLLFRYHAIDLTLDSWYSQPARKAGIILLDHCSPEEVVGENVRDAVPPYEPASKKELLHEVCSSPMKG
jgi:hypothetical protein